MTENTATYERLQREQMDLEQDFRSGNIGEAEYLWLATGKSQQMRIARDAAWAAA